MIEKTWSCRKDDRRCDMGDLQFRKEILKEFPDAIEIPRQAGKYEVWDHDNGKYVYDLIATKKDKIKKLDVDCTAEILKGFYSSALGSEHLYSGSLEAQTNLLGAKDSKEPMDYTCINAEGMKITPEHLPEQLEKVFSDGFAFKINMIKRFHVLRKQVESCETEEDINSIVW